MNNQRLENGELVDLTPAEIEEKAMRKAAYDAAEPQRALDEAIAKRTARYAAESDPLKIEAEYDAQVNNTEPDYTAWMAKVAEIKADIPLPTV